MDRRGDLPPGADHLSINLPLDYCLSTAFDPQHDPPRSCSSGIGGAPERKLTLFALRLAILEKAASGVGALGFIWATVVLLGGFAIALERTDFWLVTVILLVEGARIFSRSHELEWQHQATLSIADTGALSFRAARCLRLLISSLRLLISSPRSNLSGDFSVAGKIQNTLAGSSVDSPAATPSSARDRSWRSPEVPLVPYAGWVFLSRNISRLLYWLQLASAAACVVLSVTRLAQQDYGELKLHQAENRNRRPALNVFYGLALAEALLFLAERAFWEWKLSRCRLLEQVSRECGLGPSGVVSIRRFFYDAYSRCVNGSIFDGIRMDLVSFAEELLGSGSRDEQLIGAGILLRFATSRRFAEATLRKVGTSAAAMERLVAMLDWKSPAEVEIRRAAAVLVSKLAGKKQNALRVAGIAGAMESISSLLYTGRAANGTRPEEVTHRYLIADRADYEYSTFNLLGLRILKKLSNDHHNCGKIGNTRGLLPKIVDFTGEIGHKLRRRNSGGAGSEFEIQAAKTALQALKMLAGTTGRTGELLRREISEIVFTVSNIREILRHGEEDKALQMLAVEILTCLAMDGEARERIGATGGVVRELLRIFFSGGGRESLKAARVEAGEALAMLAVESEGNCRRIVGDGEDVVGRLVVAVEDGVVGLNACRILRNICAYGLDSGHLRQGLRGVIQAFPTVFKAVSCEEMKKLEVSVGLAAQVVRLMSHTEFAEELERAGISGTELIQRMVLILQRYSNPSTKVPRIRRFVIELSIWIMQSDEKFIKLFDDFGMMRELCNVVDTTTELECFIVFSGSVGLSRHRTSMSSLVDTALQLIKRAESS